MNMDLTNAVFIDQQLRQHPFDMFHIPARNIRYIHIPEKVTRRKQLKFSCPNYL